MNQNKPRWVFSDAEQDKWLDGPFVIIGDLSYYIENETVINSWLDDNVPDWSIEGIIIRFNSRDQMTMFRLRWF